MNCSAFGCQCATGISVTDVIKTEWNHVVKGKYVES